MPTLATTVATHGETKPTVKASPCSYKPRSMLPCSSEPRALTQGSPARPNASRPKMQPQRPKTRRLRMPSRPKLRREEPSAYALQLPNPCPLAAV
ncbi:hypothetical protein FF2_037262 [Malus domestica]